MTEQLITLKIENNIAMVHLNRADKHNAIDMAMFHALDKVSKKLRKNKAIRAVFLCGNGEDFCSGLDVKSVMNEQSNILKLLFKFIPGSSNLAQRVSTNWRKIPVPVVAIIQGRCWGGGLQIALGADFRITSPDASLSIMEAKWGLIPDMGANLALRELVNIDVAKQLAMTGKTITAEQALNYGLVTQVTDDPYQAAIEFIEPFIERSPDSVAAVKKLYNNNWNKKSWHMLAKESWYQIKVILGKNQQRAVKKQLKPDQAKDFDNRQNW
ncbi:crotonase/enoyl-CoA hydratase family protein [Thalassotalea psychrophila]|uniref:Crotonase/enoyl-CoA hydratase family protein n=1 Tax=Thalassotalea psychrophila TaxID=3065647 RepID=A0ABY9TS29_9GAMM|nr:crotonase/enoyl-CoA hydratase family protein [Colwelliaceae bacterium SQ149]